MTVSKVPKISKIEAQFSERNLTVYFRNELIQKTDER